MLKIDVVSHQGRPIADPISAVFNSAGGGIGRHPDSFLVLPDPQRHLSRRHAQISWRDNAYVIENTTGNNFVIVSGHTLHPNEFCALQEGHQIYIGHYLLEVAALDASLGRPAATVTTGRHAMPDELVPGHVGSGHLWPGHATPAALPVMPPQNSGEQVNPVAHVDALWLESDKLPASQPGRADQPVPATESIIDSFAPSSSKAESASQAEPAEPQEHYDMRAIAGAGRHAAPGDARSILDEDDFLGAASGTDPFAILHDRSTAHLPADPLIHPGDLNLAQIEPERRAESDADPFLLPSLDARNASDPLFDEQRQISLRDLVGQPRNIDDLYGDSGGHLPGLDPLTEIEPVKALGAFEPHKSLDPMALFANDAGSVQSLLDMSPAVVMDDHADQLVMHLDLPRVLAARNEHDFAASVGGAAEQGSGQSGLDELHAFAAPASLVAFASSVDAAAPEPDLKPAASAPLHTPAVSTSAAMDSDEHQTLIQAFLKSAGLPKEMVPQRLTPEFMEAVGAMLFTSMQGTVDLIAARAATKREVKAEMTLILPVHNNPLKFVPDGRAALIHMFGKQIPGFLGPIEAMKDAYQDLRAHQVGVFAGMRAALAEVLQRFSPDDVEKRLEQQSMIDSLMPGHRKAKLWDLYGQQFKKIYAEAQEDFDVIFGDAFAVAYEEQTRSMREDLASATSKGA